MGGPRLFPSCGSKPVQRVSDFVQAKADMAPSQGVHVEARLQDLQDSPDMPRSHMTQRAHVSNRTGE